MATPVATGVDVTGGTDTSSQFNIGQYIPTILEKFVAVLEAALIIIAGIFAIRYIRGKIRKFELAHEQQRNAVNLFEKITSGFIVVISITTALKIVGIDMTLLVSVAILGLSYGLQDIIKNYVAGILILFKAPFKIGNVVKIREFTGKVSKMDFQTTTIDTFDNRHITICNSDVMTQSIINFSSKTIRRLNIDVTIGYGSDIPAALQIFDHILNSDVNILKNPKFSIIFKQFSDTGPVFTLKFWVQRPCNILKIRTDVATKISQAFDEEKILAPYTMDVQTESEPDLAKISDERQKRIKAFYGSTFFAESVQPAVEQTTTAGLAPVEGQPVAGTQPPAEGQTAVEGQPAATGLPALEGQAGVEQPPAAGQPPVEGQATTTGQPPVAEQRAAIETTQIEQTDYEEPES